MAADQLGAVFEVLHAADLHADRGVELEGAAAGRDLRVAVDEVGPLFFHDGLFLLTHGTAHQIASSSV